MQQAKFKIIITIMGVVDLFYLVKRCQCLLSSRTGQSLSEKYP